MDRGGRREEGGGRRRGEGKRKEETGKRKEEVRMDEIPEMPPGSNRRDQPPSTADSGLSRSRKYHSDATIRIRRLQTIIARIFHGIKILLPRG